ncbi:MAG TPA: hypothetical protein VEX41_02915 [Candidatus Eisenbacteria bacterium]|nr:hypothetical protein [Candidatus Eisenbacteria bacterium]
MPLDPAVISAIQWTALSEQERDWLSISFYLVGLPIAGADGETSREEIELLQRSATETASQRSSFVLAQAAKRFLQEQRLADHFFNHTRLSPEEGRRRIEEAEAGARSVIAKLPEHDRHHFGAALFRSGLAVMNTKGSTRADHLALAPVLDARLNALEVDVGADLAWLEAHRPRGPARSAMAVLAGLAWLVSGALLGYFALQPMLANPGGNDPRLLGNWVLALTSLYFGGTIVLRQLGWTGLADSLLTARQADQRATWGSLLAMLRGLGVPTDIFFASVIWGVLLVAWQGYQIVQGQRDTAYVGATLAAVWAVVLSLIARAQKSSSNPEAR